MNTYPALLNTLEKYGQTHLLDFFDRLDPAARQHIIVIGLHIEMREAVGGLAVRHQENLIGH